VPFAAFVAISCSGMAGGLAFSGSALACGLAIEPEGGLPRSQCPPVIESESATGITEHDATLEAEIDPEGGTELTYLVEYGTTASYGMSAPTPPATTIWTCPLVGRCANEAPVRVEIALTGLEAGSTYHYRFKATTSCPFECIYTAGTNQAKGADATFATQDESVIEPPNPVLEEPSSSGGNPPTHGGSSENAPTRSSEENPPTNTGGGSENPPTHGSDENPPTNGSDRPASVGTPTGATAASTVAKTITPALTRAEKLAIALKACKKERLSKRAACEARARKSYGPKKPRKRAAGAL
jgi:hypothetical protein